MSRRSIWFATVAGLLLLVAAPLPAQPPRKPKPPSCKQIRDAISANHTWEQILREFDTDAEHVARCMPKGGKRRAEPKAAKKKTGAKAAAKAHTPPKAAAAKPSRAPKWTSGHPTSPRALP